MFKLQEHPFDCGSYRLVQRTRSRSQVRAMRNSLLFFVRISLLSICYRNIEDILALKGESVRKHLEIDEIFEVGDFPVENPAKDS